MDHEGKGEPTVRSFTNFTLTRTKRRFMTLGQAQHKSRHKAVRGSGGGGSKACRVVSDMSIAHDPKQTAKGKAPPSATAVTVSYASGDQGPIPILTKEGNPTVDHWWSKPLPPGIRADWRK